MINGSKNKTTDCPDCVHILLKGIVKQKKPQIHTNHEQFSSWRHLTVKEKIQKNGLIMAIIITAPLLILHMK